MNYQTILLTLTAITVSHCLYLVVMIRSLSNKVANKLLSVILILFAFRTGKSVVSLLFRDAQYVTAVIGALAMSALGPMLLFYVKRIFSDETPLRKNEYVQFLPGILCFLPVFVIEWRWTSLVYYFFTAHVIVYTIITAAYLLRKKSIYSIDDLQWKWSWQPGRSVCPFEYQLCYTNFILRSAHLFIKCDRSSFHCICTFYLRIEALETFYASFKKEAK